MKISKLKEKLMKNERIRKLLLFILREIESFCKVISHKVLRKRPKLYEILMRIPREHRYKVIMEADRDNFFIKFLFYLVTTTQSSCEYLIRRLQPELSTRFRRLGKWQQYIPKGTAPYDLSVGPTTLIGNKEDLKKFEPSQVAHLQRLQEVNRWLTNSQRTRIHGYTEMNRICSFLKLPEFIEEQGKQIFNKALEKGLFRGRCIEDFVSASVYLSCKLGNHDITIEQLSEASGIETRSIMKTYKLLIRELGIRPKHNGLEDQIISSAQKLKLSFETQKLALDYYNKIKDKRSGCGNPKSIVSALLYLASKKNHEKITEKQIGEATGVVESTIRKRKSLILKDLSKNF